MTDISVWFVPVRPGVAASPSTRCILSRDELDHIDRLGFAVDRDRAATARVAARIAIGRRLGVAPDEVPIIYARRPTVAGGKPEMSWAHSGDWVAFAICEDHPVGIDIELIPDVTPLAALALVGTRSLEEFVAAEAVGKAAGTGLTVEPPGGITTRALPAPPRYVAAVAAAGDGWRVVLRSGSCDGDVVDLDPGVAVGGPQTGPLLRRHRNSL